MTLFILNEFGRICTVARVSNGPQTCGTTLWNRSWNEFQKVTDVCAIKCARFVVLWPLKVKHLAFIRIYVIDTAHLQYQRSTPEGGGAQAK